MISSVSARLAPAPSILKELQNTLSGAADNQQAMTALLAQKGKDLTTADGALTSASNSAPGLTQLLSDAQTALLAVTPFVTCNVQTGEPSGEVRGQDEVTGPLGDAVSTAGAIAAGAQSAAGAVSNQADAVQALPDRASLFDSQIGFCVNLIEQAKASLQSGDPSLKKWNQVEGLLQGGSAKDALTPFLSGYPNAQKFTNGASDSANQAASATSAAQGAAAGMSCQGDCGEPSPIDGTYNPGGTGVIAGMNEAGQAIYQAAQASDTLPASLDQAVQFVEDLQGKLNPLIPLFQQVLQNVQKAKGMIDAMAGSGAAGS